MWVRVFLMRSNHRRNSLRISSRFIILGLGSNVTNRALVRAAKRTVSNYVIK